MFPGSPSVGAHFILGLPTPLPWLCHLQPRFCVWRTIGHLQLFRNMIVFWGWEKVGTSWEN